MNIVEDIINELPEDERIYPDAQYAKLKEAATIINDKLSELKEEIVKRYEQDPESIVDVLVVPTKGRVTVAWAKVAEEAKVASDIIEKYTKIGNPSFAIKEKKEDKSPKKYI